jgi:isoquinoline 1-oxidoreductase beta subunit
MIVRDGSKPLVQRLSRRSVLAGSSVFGVALAYGDGPFAFAAGALQEPHPLFQPNVWIRVGVDNVVTLVSPASEMGQGVMTSIPLLIAEEMDADWRKVRVVQAPSNAKAYGNPAFQGLQATGGSWTTRGYCDVMRLAGAQGRAILIASAAELLRVDPRECVTEFHVVVHIPSGRHLSFGEIASAATLPDPLPAVSKADLKEPGRWLYIGKDVPRVDVPDKVLGKPGFGIDVQREGMLFGTVARAPVQGEVPVSVDADAARATSGLVAVLPLPYGVGVIAKTTWAAWRARDALKITWSTRSPARSYDSARTLEAYAGVAARTGGPSIVVAQRGDATTAMRSATRLIETEYLTAHVHQATMEPPSATAIVGDGVVRIWGSFQAQTAVQTVAAASLGILPEKISVETTWLGGGFGRKYEVDFALDALLLAQALPGQPVKVTWTREDDVRHGKYRPLQVQHIRVGLQGQAITAWQHRLVAPSILKRYAPQDFAESGGHDRSVTEGMDPSYAMTNLLAEWRRADGVVDVGFYRAIAAGYTKFAVESTLDEVAGAIGADPLKLRLDLLAHEPRAQNVLRVVARMSEWGRRRPGSALGVAYSDAFGSHCAQIAEVVLDRECGEISVKTVWCAIDCGLAVQPTNIGAQIMGGVTHGISQALHEQITFVAGVVLESNFNDYRFLRFGEVPDIHVEIIGSQNDAPGGIGEAGLPPVGPAIANALATLTGGARLRHCPFTPDRVKAALRAAE